MWLSWLEHHPIDQNVAGSIPGQGTCLGCRFSPQSQRVGEATDWCFSLSVPSPLFKICKHVLEWRFKKSLYYHCRSLSFFIFIYLKMFIKLLQSSRHCACPLGCRHEWDAVFTGVLLMIMLFMPILHVWLQTLILEMPLLQRTSCDWRSFKSMAFPWCRYWTLHRPGPEPALPNSPVSNHRRSMSGGLTGDCEFQEIFQPNKAPKTCTDSCS